MTRYWVKLGWKQSALTSEVIQHEEWMVECFGGSDAPFLVHGQHLLQHVDKLRAVHLLRQQVLPGQVRIRMHLDNVIQAVEDILPRLKDWTNEKQPANLTQTINQSIARPERKEMASPHTISALSRNLSRHRESINEQLFNQSINRSINRSIDRYLLGFLARLCLKLIRRLEPPEGIHAPRVAVEKLGGLGGVVEHVLRRQALGLGDVANLVVLRGAGVERPAQEELRNDTPQRPHVNGLTERQAQHNFRGPIIPRLEVSGRDHFRRIACRSKIDHLKPQTRQKSSKRPQDKHGRKSTGKKWRRFPTFNRFPRVIHLLVPWYDTAAVGDRATWCFPASSPRGSVRDSSASTAPPALGTKSGGSPSAAVG